MTEATRLRQAPAAGEDAADQRVVDAELAALAVDALLGRARALVDLLRVARVGVHQDELADVVQQRGDHQAVAVLVADLGGEALGGALGGDAVQAEALGRGLPDGRALEEVEGARRARRAPARPRARARSIGLRRSTRRGRGCGPRPGWRARSTAITSATSASTAATISPTLSALLADERAARGRATRRARGSLERLERGRQAPAVALVVAASCVGGGIRGAQVRRRRLAAWGMVRVRCRRGPGSRACDTGHLSAGMDESLSPGRPVGRPRRLSSQAPQRGVDPRAATRRARARASVSKIPGETVVPASATRSGWKTSRGLRLRAPRRRRAAPRRSRRPTSPRPAAAPARRARRPAPRGRPRRATCSRAFGSSAGPSKMNPASGQKSASVWIFSSLIATASPQARRGR